MRNAKRRAGACVCLAVMCSVGTVGFGATNYVWEDGSHDSPYTNWATAANDIQSAVDAATAGNTVLVTNGTYLLTGGISITKGITVLGLGGASATIVDGNYPTLSTRCFYLQHADAVLDGFTITGGHPSGNGGGVYCDDALVRNCAIVSNWASRAGGAILYNSGAMTNCDVMYNTSDDSGGVVLFGGYLVYSRVISNSASESLGVGGVMAAGGSVTNCDILGNDGKYYGGLWFQGGTIKDCLIKHNKGFYGSVYGQSPGGLLLGCTIEDNDAEYGGGVYLDTGGTVEDCDIINNLNARHGGGVYIKTSGVVTNCTISGNTARDNGGGVYNAGTGGKVYNSKITGNGANRGGGAYLWLHGLLRNCQITGNTATDAAGVFCNHISRIENCTITDNHAQGLYSATGGIYCDDGGIVSNSIVYHNASVYNGGNHYFYVQYNLPGTNVYYTCTTPALDREGNTDQMPAFVGWTVGNFNLTEGSPCVNTGTNQPWMNAALDLDGKPRILGARVDMGAYEYFPQIHDLGIEKSVDDDTPGQGDIITYTLVVTNAGTVAATGVEVSDLLPAGVTYHDNDAPGTYNWLTGIWVIGTLPAQTTTVLHIEATVDVGTGGASITNIAVVTLGATDSDLSNNTGAVNVAVQDPGVFRFGSGSYRARETGGGLPIRVIRERGSNGVARVHFATSNYTARAEDADYTPTNGTLAFLDGEVEGMFFVPVLDDGITEGFEAIHLCLMNPDNYAELGSPAKVALGIRDDELEKITGSWDFSADASPASSAGVTLSSQPDGWSVITNGSPGAGWRFDDPGSRGNLTGGSGGFAIADSAFFGAVAMDSEMRSQSLSLTNMFTVVLVFKTDFRQGGFEKADVDVSVNGVLGPWSNVWGKMGTDYRGPATEAVDISALASGESNVVFRFHYHGATNDWWWQVDDVELRGEVDDDGDGMPDWWETLYLLNPSAPVGFDTDEDGFSDLNEFEVDTDPSNRNDYLVVSNIYVTESTVLVFDSSPQVLYRIDWTPHLPSGSWSNLVDDVQGIGGPQSIEDPDIASNRFYRLHGSRP